MGENTSIAVLDVTPLGFFYRTKYASSPLFPGDLWENPGYPILVTDKLPGVRVEDILDATQASLSREISLDYLEEILSTTIKRDSTVKVACFLACLCNYTEEEQTNVGMVASSSVGKSYVVGEIVIYFPKGDVQEYGHVSPMAFFHDRRNSTRDEKTGIWKYDISQKILIFLDQMNYGLQERLRPILSHDLREVTSQIVNKTAKSGNETETLTIRGYATFIFCTTSPAKDDQESTRLLQLSPESDQDKIAEGLKLVAFRRGDRKGFARWVLGDPRRSWLIARVLDIKNARITDVLVREHETIVRRFIEKRAGRLAPRHQRDIVKLFTLIKGHALLNWRSREKLPDGGIVASTRDVEEGIRFYEKSVAPSNELGMPPEYYGIYLKVVKAMFEANLKGYAITLQDIVNKHLEVFGYPLGYQTLAHNLIRSWSNAGLVRLERDPNDRRKWLLFSASE
jgi:hypothetical protein